MIAAQARRILPGHTVAADLTHYTLLLLEPAIGLFPPLPCGKGQHLADPAVRHVARIAAENRALANRFGYGCALAGRRSVTAAPLAQAGIQQIA